MLSDTLTDLTIYSAKEELLLLLQRVYCTTIFYWRGHWKLVWGIHTKPFEQSSRFTYCAEYTYLLPYGQKADTQYNQFKLWTKGSWKLLAMLKWNRELVLCPLSVVLGRFCKCVQICISTKLSTVTNDEDTPLSPAIAEQSYGSQQSTSALHLWVTSAQVGLTTGSGVVPTGSGVGACETKHTAITTCKRQSTKRYNIKDVKR